MSSRHLHLSPAAADSISHHETYCGRDWLELWNNPAGDMTSLLHSPSPVLLWSICPHGDECRVRIEGVSIEWGVDSIAPGCVFRVRLEERRLMLPLKVFTSIRV